MKIKSSIIDKLHPTVQRIGGIVILLLTLGLASFLAVNLVRDVPLWIFGRVIMADVLETWVERVDERQTDEIAFNYYLRYQFSTPDNRSYTRTTQVSVGEWSMAGDIGKVAVRYFPYFPQLNRLDDSRYIFILSCAYLPLIVVSWAGIQVGMYLLRQTT